MHGCPARASFRVLSELFQWLIKIVGKDELTL